MSLLHNIFTLHNTHQLSNLHNTPSFPPLGIPFHCIYYTMPFIDSQYHSSLFPEVKHSVTSTIVTDCLLTSTAVRPMMIYAATCHWKSLENEVSALLYSAPIFKRPLGSDYFTIPVTRASSGIHNDA